MTVIRLVESIVSENKFVVSTQTNVSKLGLWLDGSRINTGNDNLGNRDELTLREKFQVIERCASMVEMSETEVSDLNIGNEVEFEGGVGERLLDKNSNHWIEVVGDHECFTGEDIQHPRHHVILFVVKYAVV